MQTIVILCAVFFVAAKASPNPRATDAARSKRSPAGHKGFCYEGECGPDHWQGQCKTGRSQSPIDLSTSSSPLFGTAIDLNKAYFEPQNQWYISNNGHTTQVQVKDKLASELKYDVTDKGRTYTYRFSQMHLHWGENSNEGSEHTLNGKSFPMEIHLVHYLSKYDSLLDAVKINDKRVLSVIGIFIEVKEDGAGNPVLETIADQLSKVTVANGTKLVKVEGHPLTLTELIPKGSDLFRYEGSLTTPGCDEKVFWTVMKDPISISAASLQKFREIKDADNHNMTKNFRPTQPLGQRTLSPFKSVVHMKELMGDENKSGGSIGVSKLSALGLLAILAHVAAGRFL